MTTEALRERTTTPETGAIVTGGFRAERRQSTTVPVIPLWERPRKGGRA
jgi:hypothetical protein